MSIFKGSGVAIVTPMKANKEVNYEKLEELIEFQIKNGTDAIIICGTTGEASTLSKEEQLECIRVAVQKTGGRVPVIAGTGSNCTESAKRLSKEAQHIGVDGLLLVTPYYNKATQKGLITHYTEIATNVDVPIILYNIPGRTGCSMTPDTIKTLGDTVENIVAVKEATGDISFVAKVRHLTEGKLDIYSGNDDQIVPVMSLGGSGVISVMANLLPKETHDIVSYYLKGEVEKSRELQLAYLPLINALFCEVNPIPVKMAMNLMGLEVGPLRAPLTQLEEPHIELLKRVMKTAGIVLN